VLIIVVGLSLMWCWLLYRAVAAEYRYYKAVQTLLPEVWASLGAPKGVKVPWVFVLPRTTQHLSAIKNEVVLEFARRHYRTGRQFLWFVMATLVIAIVWLKMSVV
jgi:hypothetical protein